MKFEDHVQRCLDEAREKYSELFSREKSKIQELVAEINSYLDQFVSVELMASHRRHLHHKEGVERIVDNFSRKYGVEYSELIRTVAEKHITDDFPARDKIPKRKDFDTDGYLYY